MALANDSRIQVHLEEACDEGKLDLFEGKLELSEFKRYNTAAPCSLGDGWWISDSILL